MLKGEKSEVEELAEVMQLISQWQSHEPGDVASLSPPGISAATVPQGNERSPSNKRTRKYETWTKNKKWD